MTKHTSQARSGRDRPEEDDRLHEAIDAVWTELGLTENHVRRRAVVEARMRDAFVRGPRHNLNLVDAGLRA